MSWLFVQDTHISAQKTVMPDRNLGSSDKLANGGPNSVELR
tara:strand:+ start:353 stop:475 length:123 start_codon:yes stop_codon:yes gene_type:complete